MSFMYMLKFPLHLSTTSWRHKESGGKAPEILYLHIWKWQSCFTCRHSSRDPKISPANVVQRKIQTLCLRWKQKR